MTTSGPNTPAREHVGALSTDDAAAYLGLGSHTLANWRSAGKGPPHVRFGEKHGRISYRVVDLDQFLADRVVGGPR